MANILDSGGRREFSSGAVRDIEEGKGRCDLLPLSVVCPMMEKQEHTNILHHIDLYMKTGQKIHLYHSMYMFATLREWSIPTMVMEVSKQYEDGAVKYGEHNWEKGIPLHSYIDSAVRHFLKYVDGRDDEPHDRAFIWNILGALWTQENLPDMIDIVFTGNVLEAESNDCDSNDSKVVEEDTITVSRSKLAELLEDISPLIV